MHDESWLIVDTETDGVMYPIHAVEIAAQRMRGWRRRASLSALCSTTPYPSTPARRPSTATRASSRADTASALREAHAMFNAYAGDLPLVTFNLSFDWNRVLEPEYTHLSVPVTGRRGFCALTLTRRVVREVSNCLLENIKNHFARNRERRF